MHLRGQVTTSNEGILFSAPPPYESHVGLRQPHELMRRTGVRSSHGGIWRLELLGRPHRADEASVYLSLALKLAYFVGDNDDDKVGEASRLGRPDF
ncbi:unnamed protein product [Protopolystoma xenopodis]|uniref:Uncharacterized protein n=1 Tax=Protopolystoma xenopodis TaxID=117903 RepID=A0A3S5CMP0_9PLAT|nr:unnamed protein product [Protopolystoma xenopodis]